MQLDKLLLDLRPRPHWQALDLGMFLLRSSGSTVYAAWLALWLPLMALMCLMVWWQPQLAWLWILLPWWLRPMLERIVVYILARAVFSEHVSWLDAIKAWPGQWRGGSLRLLTWWRLFMPGRGLFQAIWQLEGARGAAAARRIDIIGRDGTASAAYWYGIVCAHFEMILMFGSTGLLSLFMSDQDLANPLSLLMASNANANEASWLGCLSEAVAGGIIGPIYSACTFTLYLNRRAALEAWDIEIVLRQLALQRASLNHLPTAKPAIVRGVLLLTFISLVSTLPAPAQAASSSDKQAKSALTCLSPQAQRAEDEAKGIKSPSFNPMPGSRHVPLNLTQTTEQQHLRDEVADIFANDDLRGFHCVEIWQLKNPLKKDDETKKSSLPHWAIGDWVAKLVKLLLVLTAIIAILWLWRRYSDRLPSWLLPRRKSANQVPPSISGWDIRPESLPDDVSAAVLQLWKDGQQRTAMALLYRASLSRLNYQHELCFPDGATEDDCVVIARNASQQGQLSDNLLSLFVAIAALWTRGAYGQRWPQQSELEELCRRWSTGFAEDSTGTDSDGAQP